MRRILVMAMSEAGVSCAERIKSLRPKDELVVLMSSAGTDHQTNIMSPVGQKLGSQWPDTSKTTAHAVSVLETESINLDFEEKNLAVSTDKGTLNLKYHELVVEVQSLPRIPRPLQKMKNVFPCPLKGYGQKPSALEHSLKEAQKNKKAVLVVGYGMPALDSVLMALDYDLRVYWLETENNNAPSLDRHFDEYLIRKLYPNVVRIKTELPAMEAMKFTETGDIVEKITLPDEASVDVGLCLWAETFLAIHPLVSEAGFFLDQWGHMDADDEKPENVHLIGSGVALPSAKICKGKVEIPNYIGSAELGLASANHIAMELLDIKESFPGQMGAASASGNGLAVFRGGLNPDDAREMEIAVEHATMQISMPDNNDKDKKKLNRLSLTLSAHSDNKAIMGYQIIGEGDYSLLAESLAGTINNLIYDSTPLTKIILRENSGRGGELLMSCALRILDKIHGPVMGITPYEFVASHEAGADFFVLDIRTKPEWTEGHVEEAYNIPALQLSSRLQSEVPRYVPIVFICEDGVKSFAAAQALSGMGAQNLYVLDGGMDLWTYGLEKK